MKLSRIVSACHILTAGLAVTSTAFAFSINEFYEWGGTAVGSADIGPSTNRTCFMTGLAGDFRPNDSLFLRPAEAGVRVNPNTGNWEIYVVPMQGPLAVWARCVNVASEERSGWVTTGADGAKDVDLGPANSSRRCFLSTISNHVYTDDQGVHRWGFNKNGAYLNQDNPYSGDHVRIVTKVAPDFTAHWYATAGHPTDKSRVHVRARCFNVSADHGSWEHIGPNPGARTDSLTSALGATCGLTGIGGKLTGSSYTDGAYVSESNGQFFINTENGKVGFSKCVK